MHLGGWLLVCACLGACLTLFYGGSIHLWIMIRTLGHVVYSWKGLKYNFPMVYYTPKALNNYGCKKKTIFIY